LRAAQSTPITRTTRPWRGPRAPVEQETRRSRCPVQHGDGLGGGQQARVQVARERAGTPQPAIDAGHCQPGWAATSRPCRGLVEPSGWSSRGQSELPAWQQVLQAFGDWDTSEAGCGWHPAICMLQGASPNRLRGPIANAATPVATAAGSIAPRRPPEWLDQGRGTARDVAPTWLNGPHQSLAGGGPRAHAPPYPRLLAAAEPVTVLDLGTGSAEFPAQLAAGPRAKGRVVRVIGVDWAARNLAIARAQLAPASCPAMRSNRVGARRRRLRHLVPVPPHFARPPRRSCCGARAAGAPGRHHDRTWSAAGCPPWPSAWSSHLRPAPLTRHDARSPSAAPTPRASCARWLSRPACTALSVLSHALAHDLVTMRRRCLTPSYDATMVGGRPGRRAPPSAWRRAAPAWCCWKPGAYPHDKLCGEFLSPECLRC